MARKKENTYYLAYGSNLNLEQMTFRCPGATVIGSATLKDYRLLFRGTPGNTHATVERVKGYTVPVLVWKINGDHEKALDVYEGFPRYYYKEFVSIKINRTIKPAMLYVMAAGRKLGAPSDYYYDVVKAGYETSGFDVEILETALRESVVAQA